MVRLKFGFGYEQALPDDAERMYGFYVSDADTGYIIMSSDTEPTESVIKALQNLTVETESERMVDWLPIETIPKEPRPCPVVELKDSNGGVTEGFWNGLSISFRIPNFDHKPPRLEFMAWRPKTSD